MTDIPEFLKQEKVIVPDDLKLSEIPKVSRPDKAVRAINFCQTLCSHTKGRWAGVQFLLLKWQWLLFWELFGTCKEDGSRQYRLTYCEIPKKNGKSELAAVVALICLVADDEIGAEVYSAASDISQAGLVYNVAAQMVRQNNVLSNRLKVIDSRKRIIDYKTNSFYQVLSAESYTKHGINPSGIIFDELHAQPNRELWDTLVEGTDYAREQQLIFAITTAGVYDKNSICWEVREHARQVSEGILKDDSLLPVIYAADKERDNWENPEVWKKTNPSLGHIFTLEKIKKDVEIVKQQPTRLNNFLRFRLNLWVNQISRWMPMDEWDACNQYPIDKGALLKRECFGGLDLSSSIDLTALALIFPPATDGELWEVLMYFWIPEDNMLERSKGDRVPYDMWVRAGHMTATPGNVVDYAYIRKKINELSELFNIKEIGYDPWGAVKLAVELTDEDGINMVETRQGYKTLSPPTKDLLVKIKSKQINHGGNPVLRWCADNLVVQTDPAENIKPAKDKARERIDGAVALIMALNRAILHEDKTSVYEKRGLRSLL